MCASRPLSTADSPFVVIVYGDVDLNYVDGSSIWLISLVSVLSYLDIDVHVVLKADIDRTLLVNDIREIPNVSLHEPSMLVGKKRLSGSEIAAAVAAVDSENPCRVLITRGREATLILAQTDEYDRRLWPYLTDIPQQPEDVTDVFLDQLSLVFAKSARILCQTEELRSFLVSYFPDSDSKTALLPPMIPDGISAREPGERNTALQVFYAGKFAPAWGIEELVRSVQELRSDFPGLELTVAGDKIHNPADDPEYPDRVRAALSSEGVNWLGALERSAVLESLRQADIAVSVRAESLDKSREISTKLLEYSAAGVPVVANRTLMHEDLFGTDYPFLVQGYRELSDELRLAAEHPDVLESSLLWLASLRSIRFRQWLEI